MHKTRTEDDKDDKRTEHTELEQVCDRTTSFHSLERERGLVQGFQGLGIRRGRGRGVGRGNIER